MKKRLLLFLGFGTGLLSACQWGITERFNAKETPQDWIGEGPIALISAQGNPTQVINNNGTQYIIYISKTGDCQTIYTVQNGIIENAQQQGNACNTIQDAAPRTIF